MFGSLLAEDTQRSNLGFACAGGDAAWLRPSAALVDLVSLINPQAHFPYGLYSGRRSKFAKPKRLCQIAFGYMRLASIRLSGRAAAILYGPNLSNAAGWVRVIPSPRWRKELSPSEWKQAFIPVPLQAGGPPSVLTALGLDPADEFVALINQNGQLVIRGMWRGKPCVMHYGANATGRQCVQRHRRGAEEALSTMGEAIGELIPDFWFESDSHDAYAYVERRVDGAIVDIAGLTEADLTRFVALALKPLQLVHDRAVSNGRTANDAFIGELSPLSSIVPHARSEVDAGLELLRQWVGTRRPLAVPAHGDYAPRNLFVDGDKVTGIIDWEWFWVDGVAGFDALKLALEVEALKRRTDVTEVIAKFLANSPMGGEFDRRIGLVGTLFGLSSEDLRHLAVLIWLRVVWMGCVMTLPKGPEWFEMVLAPASSISLSTSSQACHSC